MTPHLFLLVLMFLSVGSAADPCPRGSVQCPHKMSCCHVSDATFGCCPFSEGKCCSDHATCCPHNMECDEDHHACVSNNGSSTVLEWRVPVVLEVSESVLPEKQIVKHSNDVHLMNDHSNIICPDSSVCNAGFTCCKMFHAKYGCCPFENGTCCSDGVHCCPHGTYCTASAECYSREMDYVVGAYLMKDKKDKKLYKNKKISRIFQKKNVPVLADPFATQPNLSGTCPEKFTLCKIKGDYHGCCPYTNGQCCDDGGHCCPMGTICNATLGSCDFVKNIEWSFPSQALETLQWVKISRERMILNNSLDKDFQDVVCPDHKSRCPSGWTCCRDDGDTYGCCPLERATCCSDKTSCCPHGYRCVSGGCVREPELSWSHRLSIKATVIKNESTLGEAAELEEVKDYPDELCPDQSECDYGATCCQMTSGRYGCCAYTDATCCGDKVHCCPSGYRCDYDSCELMSGPPPHPFARVLQRLFTGKKVMDGDSF